ncbi:peptidyl-prolyl cis-trans isomerase FKBP17-1, chloroplastic isoform X2 [Asparagus officinalis]|uniref:peptidyl-prolyl cis-trans isomerase FKBP17-1, chloroplastic isoform X2 n=1 Tax=Asparagus officinalis TaxID=4686 RepID=UPI00098E3577|nr:peptidyl-prolyl cis-trans isomerase FKBP17-1, chloroplastic isoform X2 [Asparagus officinalis]
MLLVISSVLLPPPRPSTPKTLTLTPTPTPTPNFNLNRRQSITLTISSSISLLLFSPPLTLAAAPPPTPTAAGAFSDLEGSGGVKFLDLRPGDGPSPADGDQVISGIEAAVKSMKAGGIRRVIIPPSQGYQNTSQEPIPPNFFDRQRLFTTIFNPTRLANGEGSTLGTLIFDVELVSLGHL